MPDYMIFRAAVPPSFDFEAYAERSGEPIRFDAITAVEADNPTDAVNAVIAATGFVGSGFFAVEGTMIAFTSKGKLGKGGKLSASGGSAPQLAEGE